MKNVLGVIIARAGSLGLKNKHTLSLLGRPVVCYSFDHARNSRLIDRIVVSTDCPEVRKMAVLEGLDVIDRPAELATSDASVQDTVLHAMKAVESRSTGFRADVISIIYGNIPVRGADVTDRAIAKLIETGCDSVRSFCPVGKWHPAWMWKFADDGDRVIHNQPNTIHRRQDLEPLVLHEGGALVVSRASLLRGETNRSNPHALFGDDRRGVRTDMDETVEIDHLRDLYWAEAVLRERRERHREKAA